jgi:hypothetical protein
VKISARIAGKYTTYKQLGYAKKMLLAVNLVLKSTNNVTTSIGDTSKLKLKINVQRLLLGNALG